MQVFQVIKKILSDRLIHNSVYFKSSTSDTPKPNLKSLLDNSASFQEKNPSDDQWHTPVYAVKGRHQSEKSIRPKVDPKTTSVFLFPGQGSQYVGMCKSLVEFPNVKEMFDRASEILKYDLLDLCLNGPEDMLNMTAHCQVAVMVASLAAVEKMRDTNLKMIESCAATAGFSVGEYTALVFAGAVEFESAVRLLRIRGEAMQAASDLEPSGMMTVFMHPAAKIKLACAAAREWCNEQTIYDAECQIASFLFPDCKVVSGHMEALKFIESNAAKFGIKKIKHIPVNGAFHSNLMEPAKQALEKALQATNFQAPLIPVHSNYDGAVYANIEIIRKKLAKQLCHPVMWEQTMHIIFDRSNGEDFPYVYECGPGTTIKSLLRLNNAIAYRKCESVLT